MFHIRFKYRDYRHLSIKFFCVFLLGTLWSFYLFDKLLAFMVAKVSQLFFIAQTKFFLFLIQIKFINSFCNAINRIWTYEKIVLNDAFMKSYHFHWRIKYIFSMFWTKMKCKMARNHICKKSDHSHFSNVYLYYTLIVFLFCIFKKNHIIANFTANIFGKII